MVERRKAPALVLLAQAGVMGGREGGEVCRLLRRWLLLEVAVAQRGSGGQALGGVVRQQLVQQRHRAHRCVRELLRRRRTSLQDAWLTCTVGPQTRRGKSCIAGAPPCRRCGSTAECMLDEGLWFPDVSGCDRCSLGHYEAQTWCEDVAWLGSA